MNKNFPIQEMDDIYMTVGIICGKANISQLNDDVSGETK